MFLCWPLRCDSHSAGTPHRWRSPLGGYFFFLAVFFLAAFFAAFFFGAAFFLGAAFFFGAAAFFVAVFLVVAFFAAAFLVVAAFEAFFLAVAFFRLGLSAPDPPSGSAPKGRAACGEPRLLESFAVTGIEIEATKGPTASASLVLEGPRPHGEDAGTQRKQSAVE